MEVTRAAPSGAAERNEGQRQETSTPSSGQASGGSAQPGAAGAGTVENAASFRRRRAVRNDNESLRENFAAAGAQYVDLADFIEELPGLRNAVAALSNRPNNAPILLREVLQCASRWADEQRPNGTERARGNRGGRRASLASEARARALQNDLANADDRARRATEDARRLYDEREEARRQLAEERDRAEHYRTQVRRWEEWEEANRGDRSGGAGPAFSSRRLRRDDEHDGRGNSRPRYNDRNQDRR